MHQLQQVQDDEAQSQQHHDQDVLQEEPQLKWSIAIMINEYTKYAFFK